MSFAPFLSHPERPKGFKCLLGHSARSYQPKRPSVNQALNHYINFSTANGLPGASRKFCNRRVILLELIHYEISRGFI